MPRKRGCRAVTSAAIPRKSSSRLLIWLTALSLGIHVLIFMRVAGMYWSEALTFIDLTVRDLSEPTARSIPHPRIRNNVPEVRDAQNITVRERRVPQIKVEPVEVRPGSVPIGDVGMPELPDMSGVSGLKVENWAPVVSAAEFMTKQDYMEMVRLRIESRKKYPPSARSGHIEGRVKVRFKITSEGHAAAVEVAESSGHQVLDQAALKAVSDAAPFPKAPRGMFKGPLHMALTLVFELTRF